MSMSSTVRSMVRDMSAPPFAGDQFDLPLLGRVGQHGRSPTPPAVTSNSSRPAVSGRRCTPGIDPLTGKRRYLVRVGSPGGISPPGSHGTERDSLLSLRSCHLDHQGVPDPRPVSEVAGELRGDAFPSCPRLPVGT